MKNEQLKNKKTGTATPFTDLSDRDLLILFHSRNWTRLTPRSRLAAMQEVENRRAKADGRPAVKIGIDPRLGADTYGGFSPRDEVIALNIRFFQGSEKFGKFGGAKALETILHEGRHAFQHFSVKLNLPSVPAAQKIDWIAVMHHFGGVYTNRHPIIYFLQSIEMDSRRFARRKLMETQKMFAAMGMEDPEMKVQLLKTLLLEARIIVSVRQNMTLEQINAYEKIVLDHLKTTRPDLDLTNLRPFDHVRFILQHPEIKDPLKMLEALDKMADAKMSIQVDKDMNKINGSGLNKYKT